MRLINAEVENGLASDHAVDRLVNPAFCVVDITDNHVALISHPDVAARYAGVIADAGKNIGEESPVVAAAQRAAGGRIGIYLNKTNLRILRLERDDNLCSQRIEFAVAAVPEFRHAVLRNRLDNGFAQARFKVLRNFAMTEKGTDLCHIVASYFKGDHLTVSPIIMSYLI